MRNLSSNHQKYLSRNPIKQHLIDRFMTSILDAIAGIGPGSLLEIGCGEGFMTRRICERFPGLRYEALDLSQNALEIARQEAPGVRFHCASVEQLAFEDGSFDLVLCAEVLEHLPSHDLAMAEICRVSAGDILLSVPNEPYFRIANLMALNHVADLGNPPGHLRHWSKNGFIRAVEPYMNIRAVYAPFPWTIVVGRKR